jgi:hypothetical protein
MCLPLKDARKTTRCLVVDTWSNDGRESVIVLIVDVVSLIVDNHVVQDNVSTHDQPKSVLRVTLLQRSQANMISFIMPQ